MRFALLSFLILSPISSFALETDNYLAWEKDLSDSSIHINRFFSETIEGSLARISDQQKMTCEEMTILIAEDFESHLVHDNPVENWLFQVLSETEMYPMDLNYNEQSIYREPYRFYIPWFGLAPTIQVNGYYFGTDKLSHFASTGMIYYRIYQSGLQKGLSARSAVEKAIDWGIRDEKTLHGYWASGVFSYADLEANYQGLRFYQDFCKETGSFLNQNENGEWKLVRKPDIAHYVNSYWDETFELSHRLPKNWKKVSGVIKEEYCKISDAEEVRKRFQYYRRTSVPGISKEYLKQQEDLPAPQSVSLLCSED